LTVADLCNRFLTAKLRKQTAGEMGSQMFVEYKEITDLIVAAFGKGLARSTLCDRMAQAARLLAPPGSPDAVPLAPVLGDPQR
jgi:hypothetical protein